MRRGWLAALLLAGMLALALWNGWFLQGLAGELREELGRAGQVAQAGDWEGAAWITGQARDRWKSRDFYLRVTLDHAVADEITVGFSEALGSLERREAGEYATANARLMERLALLGELETPRWGNLL